MLRVRRLLRLEKAPTRLPVVPATSQAQRFSKRKLIHAAHLMRPALVALTFAGAAHAQGTMDFSGATTLMSTFKTFAIFAGAIICFGGLIFAGIRMMSGRFQLTASNRALQAANRDLGTLQRIDTDGRLTIRIDGGKEKTVTFDPREMRHFDHGYAVTSHSSQGMTSERVLVNMDTDVHPKLINSRFAYVSVSRASHEAHIYTNNAATLAEKLGYDTSKTSAIDFTKILDNSIQPGVGRPKMLDPNALGLSL